MSTRRTGHAKPFKTHYNVLHRDMCLRIAFELHLKHLLVWGLERAYRTQAAETQAAENLLGVTRQLFRSLQGPVAVQQPR